MATILMQRDLVVALKRETCLNVGILSKLQPMPTDLSRQIFKENALEKPTQNVFNNLTYYLVSIVDTKVHAAFSWPLYDSKTERTYRNQLSIFINDYSSKGLLSPVMSSYLVNPGCFKVTMFIFQLSQLAVQHVLISKMNKNRQMQAYDEMTEKYKQGNEKFLEDIEEKTETMLSKFSNYLYKRKAMENIAGMLRQKITEMENKLTSLNTQKFIDEIVDKYVENNVINEYLKTEILKIKNVHAQSKYFDLWLAEVDEIMNKIEMEWSDKVCPLLELSERTRGNTESLIARHTGEADKNSYMIEYNSQCEDINTTELQDQVNSQQKYILKNIVKNDKLNFPNLIRGFLVSICFMLKNNEMGDEIYKFNEYLEEGNRNFSDIVSAMKMLLERVMNAEARLQYSPVPFTPLFSIKDVSEIPPLPDLSDLKANKDGQIMFDTLTPFSISKHQFNLHRKHFNSFVKPQMKSALAAPFHQNSRDDFLKSLVLGQVSSYNQINSSSFHNMSIVSQNYKGNETIAECSSGFTKQQIARLLSTRKSSSTKKLKGSLRRPDINVKKGGLFNESIVSNESNELYRSYSSPNLFENREKNYYSKLSKRKLSIMQEDIPSLLEVSGIAVLDTENSYGTPEYNKNDKEINVVSIPVVSKIPVPETRKDNIFIKDKIIPTILVEAQRNSTEMKEDSKSETPKINTQLISKTSSLEKIINRFKIVRSNVISDTNKDEEFKSIVEEKENFNSVNVDVFTANRILLPDLLSPSCNISNDSTEYMDTLCFNIDEKECRKPRESLGAALGVDETFLDQFDLID
ncbi:uncharacterized protein LOC131841252 [Achroia grisella]|uniref:uncharacterized protein LOC131841252 n=1 Tax=Achroia grisella TaxID=688607 RepID=UPI0027D2E2C9|nr:uncharacterized protein LOC131841252 [Achroia grisella]